MPSDDGFPPDRDEWIVLRDRVFFAEDRLRILRSNARTHQSHLTWNPWRLRAMLRAVRVTLRAGETPDGP